MKHPLLITLTLLFTTSISAFSQIYSSGSAVNSIGTGAGGANESILQTTTFGMSTIGFGQQHASFNHIADDFTVDCQWTLDSVYFYGYQTGSTTTSTFTGYYVRIWDGIPDAPGSNVVFGDTTTNRMIASTWSGAYRVTETTMGNSTRPIMRNTIQLGVTLPAGTYYLDWSATGSLASGPWQPAVSIMGQNITGNARQRIGNTWNNLVDGGTGTPAQGAPFDLFGTITTVGADAGTDATICENGSIVLGGAPTGTSNIGSSLSYSWSNVPAIDSTMSNPTITVTDTTEFVVTVIDANGCSDTDTVQVFSVSPIAVNILPTSVSEFCPQGTGLLITDQSMNILWSTGQTDDTIYVNVAGQYDVTYIDGNGCSSSDTVSVTELVAPTIVAPNDMNICQGDTVSLFATGGIDYLWDNAYPNGTEVYPTQTTTYSVLGSDTSGCVGSSSFTVNVFQATNGSTTVSGVDSVQVNGVMYYQDGTYTQTLTNAAGCDSILTVEVQLEFTSIAEWDASVSISPNPMNQYLNINLNGTKERSFKLITMMGQVVSEFAVSGSKTVDVSALSAGSYFIVDESNEQKLLLIKN